MTAEQIWNLILLVLTIVAGGLSLYLKTKTGLLQKAGEYIAQAEGLYKGTTQAGGQKFIWVVDQLYNLVPTPLRLVLSRELIGTLVQNAFDAIENYATKQLDKAVGKLESKEL